MFSPPQDERAFAGGWRQRGDMRILLSPQPELALSTSVGHGYPGAAWAQSMTRRMYLGATCSLKRITGMKVEPLLVFSRAYLTPAVSRQEGVVVLPSRLFAGHRERRATILSADQTATVHARLAAALS
jgi:hypothetical protein